MPARLSLTFVQVPLSKSIFPVHNFEMKGGFNRYKAWGTLLGQQLVERDIIVVCIDYRNFPQGCISNMVSDVTTGIGYVIQNVGSYGGDADRLVCNTNHTFCCWTIADPAHSAHNL
jgi:hypothetical protein